MPSDPAVPRLLAVMAHPDDAEILVGGTLFHLKTLGWELGILTMTAGDCGSTTIPRERSLGFAMPRPKRRRSFWAPRTLAPA